MDEQLAAIYGTGQPEAFDNDDLQKTAAAEMLVKIAEEEGVNLNDFSDDEIGEMVGELYADDGGHDAGEEGAEDEGGEEVHEEKVAEADFLGRVMAHSMVQELGNIEKSAAEGQKELGQGSKAGLYARQAKAKAQELGGKAKELGGKAYKHQKGHLRNVVQQARGLAGSKKVELTGTKGQAVKNIAKSLGKASPTLLAAGGLTYGGVKGVKALMGKKKEGSAELDKIAEQRALELAAEAGWVTDDGQLLAPPEQEKTAELEAAIEARALEMLEAEGYPVEWTE